MKDLRGKKIIVTGASGGIGNSIIEKLNEAGANILASGTRIEKLDELKSKYENTFSVIIPCYNSENFISNAIQSVLNQTNEVEELIIVDDGSSDNSVKVIKDLFTKNRSRKIQIFPIKDRSS